jgi:hypothetical protein
VAGLTLPALSASASTVKVGVDFANNPGRSVYVGHTFEVGVKAGGSRWYLADVHGPSGKRFSVTTHGAVTPAPPGSGGTPPATAPASVFHGD